MIIEPYPRDTDLTDLGFHQGMMVFFKVFPNGVTVPSGLIATVLGAQIFVEWMLLVLQGISKTQLNVSFIYNIHLVLEKEMATHSSVLAWKIPWTEEPGELQSMGSQESDMT